MGARILATRCTALAGISLPGTLTFNKAEYLHHVSNSVLDVVAKCLTQVMSKEISQPTTNWVDKFTIFLSFTNDLEQPSWFLKNTLSETCKNR